MGSPMLSNQASRLLGGARGLAVPVPSLGAGRVVNGEFATASPLGWAPGPGGNNTVIARVDCATSPNIAPTGGADEYALGVTSVLGTSFAYAYPNPTISVGDWYLASGRMYIPATNAVKSARIRFVSSSASTVAAGQWVGFLRVGRVAVSQPIYLDNQSATNGDIVYFDAISFRVLSLASMFSTRAYTTHATTKARATVVAGTRAGVVANLDSASSPANFVIASHDGQLARLTKCVAGTYTELVSAAATYVAGAFVEIRRPAGGDVWALYYNGVQVGANQTISDAAIKAGTLHGYFNTYAGNLLSEFSCVASA